MSNCARCGQGICSAQDKIALNKVWHRRCFDCFCCRVPLEPRSAYVSRGEIFCKCCYEALQACKKCCPSTDCGQERILTYCPLSSCVPCRSCSSPSLIPCPRSFRKTCVCPCPIAECCLSKARAAHSCSCIPCPKKRLCSPLPREVANYYNRNPICPAPMCDCPDPRFCSCKRPCSPCRSPCSPCTCVKCCPCPPPECCPPRDCCNPCPPPCCPPRDCCAPCCPPRDCCCPPRDCCPPPDCCLPPGCFRPPPCYDPCCPPDCAPECCPDFCSKCCKPKPCCKPRCPPKCCTPSRRIKKCCPPAKCCPPRSCSPRRRPCSPCPPCSPCRCGDPDCCSCKYECYDPRTSICTPCCRRCGKKVYVAERILASGGAFHSSCFSCYCCNRPLDVTNVNENDGEIYCKQCYNTFFCCTRIR